MTLVIPTAVAGRGPPQEESDLVHMLRHGLKVQKAEDSQLTTPVGSRDARKGSRPKKPKPRNKLNEKYKLKTKENRRGDTGRSKQH